MRIIPISSVDEYVELQNIEVPVKSNGNLSDNPKQFANWVTSHRYPCMLSYLPGINCEKIGYQDISISEFVLHRNAKMLIQAPCSGELYDAKSAYMEAFSSKSAYASFFGNTSLSTMSMRTVVELILLFDLTVEELQLLSTIPCKLESAGSRIPLFNLLRDFPTNNDIAKKIEEVHRKAKSVSLPTRLVKMKRLMFIDAVHAFRAMGVNPYEAIIAIAKKDDAWFKNCQIGELDPRAFDLKSLTSYLIEAFETPKAIEAATKADEKQVESTENTPAMSETSSDPQSFSVDEVPQDEKAELEASVPISEADIAAMAVAPSALLGSVATTATTLAPTPLFKVSLQARVCFPCDADAWDNDNPNRDEPGYKWETCNEDICKRIADKMQSMELRDLNPETIQDYLKNEFKNPFRAKVEVDGRRFKLVLQV